MYRILLVDDEPLVLSGIKRLIDWEKNGSLVAGIASNGQEALEKLVKVRPDIVICDIAMPGLSGLDLLKQADTEFAGTVFIMLTNQEEFEFAREALRYRAVEYLVKSNLEAEILEKALKRAINELKNRNKLHRVEEADDYLRARQRQTQIRSAVTRLMETDAPLPPEETGLLAAEGMLTRFAFAFIPLNFAVLPEYPDISPEERRKILEWELEIAERLCSSFFPRFLLLPHSSAGSGAADSFLLFVWGEDSSKNNVTNAGKVNPESWESSLARFRERFIKISGQITRLGVEVLACGFYETADFSESPARRLSRIKQQYRLTDRESHSEAVKKARQYILDNVEKRIMLHEVAEYVCISPGYLSTLFRRECKQNLVDFINEAKIDLACGLLRENKYRINEISYKLGFENAFYFTRVFHRRTGLTPSEYQSRARQGTESP
ncbi:MAG: response regulator [Treponema sp.]|jgi:two-component system response regulator YesN|nr:response regulator [Treponema sp.]